MATNLFGVLGWPVKHSVSPAMMKAAFQQARVDAVYLPFPVEKGLLRTAVAGLCALSAGGVNVTIPHKIAAFDCCQEWTSEAKSVGAVNTLKFVDGKVIGHNTDVAGWWASIRDYLTPLSTTFAVLGAGGACMAVLAALAAHRRGAKVLLIARNSTEMAKQKTRFGQALDFELIPFDRRHEAIARAQVVVQTTPVGMWPDAHQSPVLDVTVFGSQQIVQDVVYRPEMTTFLEQAQSMGATIVTGVSMLVHQGAAAYEYWLGQSPDLSIMDAAARFQLRRAADRG